MALGFKGSRAVANHGIGAMANTIGPTLAARCRNMSQRRTSFGVARKHARCAGRRQTVAISMHRMDEARMVGIWLDFLAEPRDRMVDRACARHFQVTPDLAQQLIAVDNALLTFSEVLGELEFAVCQMQRVSGPGRGLSAEVNDHEAQYQLLDRRSRAAQHGLDAGQALLQVEWLGDVVVGSEV